MLPADMWNSRTVMWGNIDFSWGKGGVFDTSIFFFAELIVKASSAELGL